MTNQNQNKSKNFDLLVIGDVSIDLYMIIDDHKNVTFDEETGQEKMCFIHGSKVPVKKSQEALAGNAAHVSVGASRLGLSTAIYTELGDDSHAENFLNMFKNEKIDTGFCNKNKGTRTNTHAIIVCDDDRTIFSYHEPRGYGLDFESLSKRPPQFIYYTSLGVGFENFQEKFLDFLNSNPNVVVAFNPGTMQMKAGLESIQNVLQKVNILFVNKEEAMRLCKVNGNNEVRTEDLHSSLQSLGPTMTIITEGKNGASASDGSQYIHTEAPKITGEVVDKTGAGDSFAAAFLSALFYNKPIATAMNWGNNNAASIVTKIGAIDGLLSKEHME